MPLSVHGTSIPVTRCFKIGPSVGTCWRGGSISWLRKKTLSNIFCIALDRILLYNGFTPNGYLSDSLADTVSPLLKKSVSLREKRNEASPLPDRLSLLATSN